MKELEQNIQLETVIQEQREISLLGTVRVLKDGLKFFMLHEGKVTELIPVYDDVTFGQEAKGKISVPKDAIIVRALNLKNARKKFGIKE